MESMPVLRWMSRQGWTEVYLSPQTNNPTTGAGAVLFNVTAPADIFMLRFTVFNDAAVPLEYVVETDVNLGAGWEEQARWSVDAKSSGRFDKHFPVYAGEKIRLAVAADPGASGVSLAGVEYLQSQ
jgi:hypothetical protein